MRRPPTRRFRGPIGSYEALLADPAIDAVYIPLPNHLHAEWAVKAAEAGKHVLCEKPLALTAADVDRMRDAAARSRVHLAEAFMYRHHAQTGVIRALVADGVVGPLRMIRGAFSFSLDRPADVRFDPRMGGGSLWDIGCYPVSYARLLAGARSPRGSGNHRYRTDRHRRELRRRPPVRRRAARVDRLQLRRPVPHAARDRRRGGYDPCHASLQADARETVSIVKADRVEEVTVEGRPLYVDQVEDFARAARGGEPPVVSLDDSRGNVATLAALLESASTGRSVRLATGRSG